MLSFPLLLIIVGVVGSFSSSTISMVVDGWSCWFVLPADDGWGVSDCGDSCSISSTCR